MRLGLVVLVVVLAAVCVSRREAHPPVRFATFNIEDFPKDARQIEGAFREIGALDAGFVAVQEIGEPEVFVREARRRLGGRWSLVSADTRPLGETQPRGHHIGVLFDTARWQLLGSRVHDETRLEGGRHKPVLEVRLRGGDEIVRVLVVHLKFGSEGREIRARQLAALAGIVREVERCGERIVVLGDFNATELADRDDLAQLALSTHLVWATESLACSAFWARDDGCPRSRLDHVLMSVKPASVHAAGACATEGCDWQASCPTYAHEISDHCPVVVNLD
jgi:endonuclease/exonuclease/phosphatase family metal-dependent hydrolase